MKKITIISMIAAAATLISCDGFLDIVPDNVATIDNGFSLRANAEKYLHTCYSYIPSMSGSNSPDKWIGGEFTTFADNASSFGYNGWYITRGYQTAASPYCDYWTGARGGKDLYAGIRNCNILIANIDRVADMESFEINRWKAEAKFLKAYFHFLLTRMYGPIPIVDVNKEVSASIEDVHVYRSTIDECFEYIVKTLDEILQEECLPDMIELEASELGRITKGIVLAFKAQVLMYAASPLFNGNTDYKGYTDSRGVEIFCPEKSAEERLARWQAAADACKVAIDFLEQTGYRLYSYTGTDYAITDQTRLMVTRRNAFNLPDNKENIWYYTNANANQYASYPFQFTTNGSSSSIGTGEAGILSVPIEITELYYTANGLPMEDDVTFDSFGAMDLRTATAEDKLYIEPGFTTVGMHFGREARFYSDIAFNGGSWFGNGTPTDGTVFLHKNYGWPQVSNITGYWPRKYVNIKSVLSGTTFTYSSYHFPLFSLRQLYLYYAEALNEVGTDYVEVLPWINEIRSRAGIPDVATSWERYSNNPDRYKTKEGLRSIIHREEMIEMMFEGQMAWDLRRWKEAYAEMNRTLNGWQFQKDNVKAEEYYVLNPLYVQRFEAKDYFQPIKNSEIYANKNIVQNPGW